MNALPDLKVDEETCSALRRWVDETFDGDYAEAIDVFDQIASGEPAGWLE